MKNCLSNDGQFFVIKTLIVPERVLKQISNIHSLEFIHRQKNQNPKGLLDL
jgi:hypothetical protein